MCRGGRRPADPCSKQGMGERMQSAAGDLCSALVFILCYHRRNKEISAWQQSQGSTAALGGRESFAAGCGSVGPQRIKSGLDELTRTNLCLVTCQNNVRRVVGMIEI